MPSDAPRELDVDEYHHEKFKDLVQNERSPFYKKTMGDVFIYAMALGYFNNETIPLKKRKGTIPLTAVKDQLWLIKSIAISKTNYLGVLLNEKDIYEIAEEYANGGIVLLYNMVLGDHPGDSDKLLEAQIRDILLSSSTSKTANEESLENDFKELISRGENESVEYKSTILWSKDYSKEQIIESKSKELNLFGKETSKIIIARTIAGFLNTEGGNLIVGIKENKDQNKNEIIGIEDEIPILKDPCIDGYRRMIVDEIIRKYFHADIYNHLSKYMKITFPQIDGKTLCWFQIKKSDIKVFLSINKKDYFYIRVDAETREIEGKQMVDYCDKHFI